MTNSVESGRPDEPIQPSPEVYNFDDLMDYIRGLFYRAYTIEGDEEVHGPKVLNGSFYQEVPLPVGHELTRNSVRILLKPPHPNDKEGTYCEVFAVFLKGRDGHLVPDNSDVYANQYLLREYEDYEASDWLMVDADGVHKVDVNEFDALDGFAVNVDEIDPLENYRRGQQVLSKLETYNIVAMTD